MLRDDKAGELIAAAISELSPEQLNKLFDYIDKLRRAKAKRK
jgi:hypothetical protein